MKKLIFAALLLPALLVSCKGGNKDKDYQVTKEVFEHELDPHTVIFESNYQVTNDYTGMHLINEIDYGKVILNAKTRYAFEKYNNGIKQITLDIYGNKLDEYTYSDINSFYSMWFGEFYCLFSLKYEDFTYDRSVQAYRCGRIVYDQYHIVEYGLAKAYKNKPTYLEFYIQGLGLYTISICRHGEISIPYK